MPPLAQSFPWMIFAGIAALVLSGLFVLCVVLVYRVAQSSRQFTHAERMRSLEAGLPLEAPEATKLLGRALHNAFWISFWLAIGVPSAAFSAASTASAATSLNLSTGLAIAIWVAAASASVASVICATVVIVQSLRGGRCPESPQAAAEA